MALMRDGVPDLGKKQVLTGTAPPTRSGFVQRRRLAQPT